MGVFFRKSIGLDKRKNHAGRPSLQISLENNLATIVGYDLAHSNVALSKASTEMTSISHDRNTAISSKKCLRKRRVLPNLGRGLFLENELFKRLRLRTVKRNALFLFYRIGHHVVMLFRVKPNYLGRRFQKVRTRGWVIFFGKNQEFVFLRKKLHQFGTTLNAYRTLGINA